MSENINILPNRFENYVIEKPSEYRVVDSDYHHALYKDKNNNVICIDINSYTILFKYEPTETAPLFHFEYSRYINLRIKNEKKLFKRSKKIVKRFLRRQDLNCNIE